MSWTLVWNWRADDSSVISSSASSEVAPDGLVDNLRDTDGCSFGKSWRTSTTTATADVTFSFAVGIGYSVVPGSNITAGATTMDLVPGVGGPFPYTYNEAANLWVRVPGGFPASSATWGLSIVDLSNPEGEIRVPFFGIASAAVSIDDCYRPEKDWEIVDPSFFSDNDLGGRHVNEQRIFRRMRIRFGPMPWDAPDSVSLRAFLRMVGTHRPFLVILDDENLDVDGNVIFGCLERMPRLRGSAGRMMRGEMQILSIEN